MKKALITGITGQDGSYLTEILIEKGYEVHGIVRRSSSFNTARLEHLYTDPEVLDERMFLYYGDLIDASSLNRLLDKVEPDEIYNLGAQSHVKVSFEIPDYTAQVDALGTLRFLDAIRETGLVRQVKFFQASTSELYGKVREIPQTETTPFYPRSPYATAKLYAFWTVINYREAYNLFASNGIMFNHESPRRGKTFVTKKITRAVAAIVLGKDDALFLGNLEAKRDWGFAPEYCEGMWRIMQHEKADDFVLATGETHSVREFIEKTFKYLGIEIGWRGTDENEIGVIASIDKDVLREITQTGEQFVKVNQTVVRINPSYFRPTEVDILIGDSSKAQKVLGWKARTKFEALIKIMVDADILFIKKSVVGLLNQALSAFRISEMNAADFDKKWNRTDDELPENPVVVIEANRSSLWFDLQKLWNYRDLLFVLTVRDIKVRYKQTFLGVLWVIIQPVLMMLFFTLIFGRLAGMPSDGIPYPIFAYAGLLPWTFFSNSLNGSANSLVGNSSLITKVYFPRMIIPIASVGAVLVDFLIAFGLLVLLMFYYGIALSINILMLPVLAFLTALAAIGAGIWLSALNVKYRDVRYALPFITQFWMFATPIIYPSTLIPEKWRWLLKLNPLTGIIEGYRSAIFGKPFDLAGLGISVIIIIIALLYSIYAFRRMERNFADIV